MLGYVGFEVDDGIAIAQKIEHLIAHGQLCGFARRQAIVAKIDTASTTGMPVDMHGAGQAGLALVSRMSAMFSDA